MTLRRRVVLASRNRHKVAEIGALLSDLGIDLISVDDIAAGVALDENEPTFEENALAKARQAAQATGLPAIGDDSGLEVDALHGEPGVRSARYAGEPCDDQRNNQKLLEALRGVGMGQRTGRFRCAAAYVDPVAGIELVRNGSCEGFVLEHPMGEGGFGYDPLFFIEPLGRTMAEIPIEHKNLLSHRAMAFRALAYSLASLLARQDADGTGGGAGAGGAGAGL